MTLLEVYANTTGVKIPTKPVQPFTKYYPTPDKYITVSSGSGMDSKNYDHFNFVLQFVSHALQRNGIKIIQLGSNKDYKINNSIDLRDKTDLYQSNFILKNALLHLGNDSFFQHVCGSFNVPTVIAFGPTYAAVCASFFKNSKSVFIEGERKGGKPSHAAQEYPKSINTIKPEILAQAILDILEIDEKIKFKTNNIGNNYYYSNLNVLPNFVPPNGFYGDNPLKIRMDLHQNEQVLDIILKTRKCNIVCYEPINLEILNKNRTNIIGIEYKVWDDNAFNINFLKSIQGFNHVVSTKLTGSKLANLKKYAFEFSSIKQEKPIEKTCISGIYFKTNSLYVSEGKTYLSLWHLNNDLYQTSDCNSALLPEEPDDEFYQNLDKHYIYEIV